MSDFTTPEVAYSRINAIYKATRNLSIETGRDPAEAAFELVCAAIMIIHEARSLKMPADLISAIAPDAAATVEAWFSDELKQFRCRDG